MASNDEDKRCPLCAEEMDWTDQQFKPCQCGYQVCVWCWHHMIDMAEKDETEARCPACRTVYEKEKIMAMQASCERTTSKISNRMARPAKAKPKANEVKKDLTNVRVIQRKIAFVIGLPLSLADEKLLQQKKYFGQYGKIIKVCLSRTAGGPIKQLGNDTCSVYITYSKEEEALQCIQSVHGFILEDRFLRASFGTAKYCHAWLKSMSCNNSDCFYLHTMATDEDTLGRDDVAAVQTRSRVQEIIGAANTRLGKRSGSVLPPPVVVNTHRSIDMTCSLPCTESGVIDGPHEMTTFVNNVGRDIYNSSGPGKDGTTPQDWRISSLSSDLSSVTIDEDVSKVDAFAFYKVSSTKHVDGILEDGLNDSMVKRKPKKKIHDSGASLPIKSVNMVLSNDAYQEVKFRSSAKSDRVYRNSNSFSNEEIVEHLRRIDDDDNNMANIEENLALNVVKNSIISNIMSIDFGSCDDSLTMPSGLSELLDKPPNGLSGSSWNSFDSDQSGYSFMKQNGFASQIVESARLGYGEKRDQYLCKPQYPVTRTQNFAPLGSFPVPSRDTPPGFSSSGHHLVNSSLSSNNMLQQSTGFNSSPGDIDLNTFDDKALRFLMQKSATKCPDSKFSQMSLPRTSSMQYDPRYMENRSSDRNGISSMLVNQHQNCYQPTVSQQKYSTGRNQNGNEHLHGTDDIPTQWW